MRDEPFRGQPDAVEIIARAACQETCAKLFGSPELRQAFLDKFWPEHVSTAVAVLAALNAAGLVIVPKEPTKAMIDAWVESTDLDGTGLTDEEWETAQAAEIWSAMIEASQTLAADGSSKNPTEDRE